MPGSHDDGGRTERVGDAGSKNKEYDGHGQGVVVKDEIADRVLPGCWVGRWEQKLMEHHDNDAEECGN